MSMIGRITPIPSKVYTEKPIASGHRAELNAERLLPYHPSFFTSIPAKMQITIIVTIIMTSPKR